MTKGIQSLLVVIALSTIGLCGPAKGQTDGSGGKTVGDVSVIVPKNPNANGQYDVQIEGTISWNLGSDPLDTGTGICYINHNDPLDSSLATQNGLSTKYAAVPGTVRTYKYLLVVPLNPGKYKVKISDIKGIFFSKYPDPGNSPFSFSVP